MSESRDLEPGMRRSLTVVLLICALAFAAFTMLVRHLRAPSQEPPIPVHPAARQVRHWLVEQTGYQKTVYLVDEKYPSKRVYEYYRSTLSRQGYTPQTGDDRPSWRLDRVSSDENTYLLQAGWVDAQRLHVFTLSTRAKEKVRRDRESNRIVSREIIPGIEVVCTLSRSVVFGD